jgi:hypothetical protein
VLGHAAILQSRAAIVPRRCEVGYLHDIAKHAPENTRPKKHQGRMLINIRPWLQTLSSMSSN